MIRVVITPKKPKVEIVFPGTQKPDIQVDVGAPHSGTGEDIYRGETIVTPIAYNIVELETMNKIVEDNIIVLPIPYSETSNPYGGNTVYIGE